MPPMYIVARRVVGRSERERELEMARARTDMQPYTFFGLAGSSSATRPLGRPLPRVFSALLGSRVVFENTKMWRAVRDVLIGDVEVP